MIEDNFFQAAFGGSFLNHQWLIAAASPTYPNAPANLHSIIDSNGMPVEVPALHADRPGAARAAHRRLPVAGRRTARAATSRSTRCSRRPAVRRVRREAAAADGADDRRPADGERRRLGLVLRRLVERRRRLDGAGLDERPGPDAAPIRTSIPSSPYPHCPDRLFQFHHQPFNYFANYAPGTPGRDAPAGRGRVPAARRRLVDDVRPQAGQLRQADRRGERASRLRERAERQRPSRDAAASRSRAARARRTRW